MNNKQEQGFTLTEMILVAGMVGVCLLASVRLITPITTFFHRSQARQLGNLEARTCMDMIQRVMANGKVSTLSITTPPTIPSVPFSQAQFVGVDESSYTVRWSTSPMNTVHLQRQPLGGPMSDTILANHVTGLHFTLDLNFPTHITATLQVSVPIDGSGLPNSVETILLLNSPIVMLSS